MVRAEYPVLQGRKLILYVPTFRDEETEHPRLALDPGAFCEKLGEEYVLGIRLHPHVAAAFRLEETKGVINFSSYPDLDRLLLAADMLVTDYSSVAFDYAVLERPMFFYAYDLESFSRDGRGFYEAYETLVPGPVARTQEELEQLISSGVFDREKIESFLERYYECTDGRSTGRVCDLIREKER